MKTEFDEKSLLKVLLIAIAFYFAILRVDLLMGYISAFWSILTPFVAGGVLAFIINVLMVKVEKVLEKTKLKKSRRGIALLITVAILISLISGFLMIVVPQLVETISTLVVRLQIFINKIPIILESHSENLTFIEEYILGLNINWQDISQRISRTLQGFALSLVNSGPGFVSGIVDGFVNAFMAVIFAIYLLFGKEKNKSGLTDLLKAVADEKISNRVLYIFNLTYRNFAGFLSGQCVEAVILGAMFVVAMTIFRLPYAFLIGVIIAVTALIPVFGAFIGCIIGMVLIAIESPVQAFVFLAVFLVLQQFEGNVIYPKVVGNSIGLPSILVFMSVILGNSLMGVTGMLIFIPAVSVLYTLIKEFVNKRSEQRAVVSEQENPR